MGRVATAAAFSFHRYMLEYKRPLLVDVALRASRIPARQSLHLSHCPGPMRIMAVAALYQALVNPVVVGFGEIRLGRSMASVAQLRLALHH